jgi:two-component system, OmpR family, sensor histidine kinase KdpD
VELVYDVVHRVEENNPHRKINISINQNMPFCYLDKGMLDQVLYNLVNNAALHTAPGCTINVSASLHADLLEMIVEDNGHGFRPGEMKDAFHKFSRDKSSKTAGRGLGLSIVKGFTEALGGSVGLERGSMGGARFTVLIPTKISQITFNE